MHGGMRTLEHKLGRRLLCGPVRERNPADVEHGERHGGVTLGKRTVEEAGAANRAAVAWRPPRGSRDEIEQLTRFVLGKRSVGRARHEASSEWRSFGRGSHHQASGTVPRSCHVSNMSNQIRSPLNLIDAAEKQPRGQSSGSAVRAAVTAFKSVATAIRAGMERCELGTT